MTKSDLVDSSRYVYKLEAVHNSTQDLSVLFASLYQVDERGSGSVDIYEPVVVFLVALFTKNGDVLFAVFGLVFGFFYSRNIWFLFECIKSKEINILLWLVLISFVCVVGFWSLGGVRMWTAGHIYFFGTTKYFSGRKKIGLFIAISTILIHFSFILPVVLLVIYIWIKPPNNILFYLFLGTLVFSSLELKVVSNFIESYLPQILEARTVNYTSEDYAERISQLNASGNWYIVNLNKVLLFVVTGIFCFFHFQSTFLKRLNNIGYNIYGFSLTLLILANLLSGVPSGVRYMLLAQLFALAAIVNFLSLKLPKYVIRNISYTWPFFVFFIIVSMRVAFDSLTFDGVFSNPILVLIANTGIPIIDLIK